MNNSTTKSRSRERYNVLFWVLVGCTIITIITTAFMMYRMYRPKPPVTTMPPKPQGDSIVEYAPREFFSGSKSIVYIYSQTCGWCDRFNPIWKDFTERYTGTLELKKIEAREEYAKKYHVNGYPTVMIVTDGVQGDLFQDERSVENLLKFAKSYEATS